MEQPTFVGLKCKRAACEAMPVGKTGFCRPCFLERFYAPCGACGKLRRKNTDTGLCSSCYWKQRRADSPFTGLSRREYDAQRYNPARNRARLLLRKYGLTVEQYWALYERQDGACAICRASFADAKLTHGSPVVDHCHETGQVRGLLCDLCNKGLGQFRDDIERVRRAYEYLKAADGPVLDPVDPVGNHVPGN